MLGSIPEDVVDGFAVDRCAELLVYIVPLPRPSTVTSPPPFHQLVSIGIQRYLLCSRMTSVL
jgi:hypothetical protein